MLKRSFAAVLAAVLLAPLLSGCGSVFSKEYFSVSDYTNPDTDENVLSDENGVVNVRDLFSIKLAITQMVSAHEDGGLLSLKDYSGDAADDVATACKEVSTNTALGSFCVDYITFDLDRIIAYYEATVYITYKRTAEEVDSIQRVSTPSDAEAAICGALRSMDSGLTLMTSSGYTDIEDVEGFVTAAEHSDPLLSVQSPEVRITPYIGGGRQRIFEVSFSYGISEAAAELRVKELSEAAGEIAENINAKGDAYILLAAARALLADCAFDPEDGGSTAWDALVRGSADSEGLALGFSALCEKLGLECLTVSGMMDNAVHFWNIMRVGKDCYHADLSRAEAEGLGTVFLVNDKNMGSRYLWDREQYPACSGHLGYGELAAEISPSPSASQGGENEETTPPETSVPEPSGTVQST